MRAHADAERARRALSPVERVSALQPYIDEELAGLRRHFGDDERLRPIAVTFAMQRVLAGGGDAHADGEALIEADVASEKLDAGEPFSEQLFSGWAQSVTASPPNNAKRTRKTPSDHALLAAVEMYLAFSLTNGLAAKAMPSLSFDDPFFEALCATAERELTRVTRRRRGQRLALDRDPKEIVHAWASRARLLKKAYRPSGDPRAPLRFLATDFRYRLGDEKRVVEGIVVRPGWINAMRRRGWLGRDEVLTEQRVLDLMARAEQMRTHAPPASFMTSATLRDRLIERQELTKLALAFERARAAGEPTQQIYEQLVDAELWGEVAEWLEESPPGRRPLPSGALAVEVPTSKRSVDALVLAYERQRREPFANESRSRRIPVGELDEIVAFANTKANAKAEKRRR